jgi:hypothetical protein
MSRGFIINLHRDTEHRRRNAGTAFATGVFEVIVEGTRKHFPAHQAECMRLCYRELDELFQQYMAIDDVDADCFNVFVRACEAGLAQFEPTGQTHWKTTLDPDWTKLVSREWRELIQKLHADPRYNALAEELTTPPASST